MVNISDRTLTNNSEMCGKRHDYSNNKTELSWYYNHSVSALSDIWHLMLKNYSSVTTISFTRTSSIKYPDTKLEGPEAKQIGYRRPQHCITQIGPIFRPIGLFDRSISHFHANVIEHNFGNNNYNITNNPYIFCKYRRHRKICLAIQPPNDDASFLT